MKKKGTGMALVLHPSGNQGAGDPSNAAIQLKNDGTLVLLVGAVDLGQGSTTILRQFAADLMEVPIEDIFASNFAEPDLEENDRNSATVICDVALVERCRPADFQGRHRRWRRGQ